MFGTKYVTLGLATDPNSTPSCTLNTTRSDIESKQTLCRQSNKDAVISWVRSHTGARATVDSLLGKIAGSPRTSNRAFDIQISDAHIDKKPSNRGWHQAISKVRRKQACQLPGHQFFRLSVNENQIVSIAGRVVSKSQGLRKRSRDEMEKLEGWDNKWEFAREIARLTQEQAENVAFAAHFPQDELGMIKKIWRGI